MKQQIFMPTRATIEQRAGPVDRALRGGSTFALATMLQASGAGFGIRPRVRSRANA